MVANVACGRPERKAAESFLGHELVSPRAWDVASREPRRCRFREGFASESWIAVDRDAWLVIERFKITGRRPQTQRVPSAFDPGAYL